jgi:hypothetical protein
MYDAYFDQTAIRPQVALAIGSANDSHQFSISTLERYGSGTQFEQIYCYGARH